MKALFATDYSHGARVARELLASLDWPRGTAFRVVTAYEPLELFGAPMIDVLAEYWWLALLLIGGALLVAGSLAGPRGSV